MSSYHSIGRMKGEFSKKLDKEIEYILKHDPKTCSICKEDFVRLRNYLRLSMEENAMIIHVCPACWRKSMNRAKELTNEFGYNDGMEKYFKELKQLTRGKANEN